MFRHVVLLRFIPTSTPEEHRAVARALRRLPATIDELVTYDVDLDAGLADTNAHLVVTATFADELGWRTYAGHPDHLRVIHDFIEPILESSLRSQHEC